MERRKNPVRVCVRTRPTANFAQDQIIIDGDNNTIKIIERQHDGHNDDKHNDDYLNNKKDSWNFKFDHVLHNAGQETVFELLSRETVAQCLEGVNGTIMCYGQTGAGKTFTMIGDVHNYKHRGIAPRALGMVFEEIAARPQVNFKVTATYMELYNERIFDLLNDGSSTRNNSGKDSSYAIIEDTKGGKGVYVRGLTEVSIASEEEALILLMRGDTNRTTAEHLLNKNSNRSHCIFTVNIRQSSRLTQGTVLKSKLNLVDLAGSERLKKTLMYEEENEKKSSGRGSGGTYAVDETTKKESMYINKSLTYLEQCVVALSTRNRSHVPYRQTKLTNVLKDSLGGNCNTLMLACIWGEGKHLEETISTLKLAQRMMRVENRVMLNVETDPVALTKKYERTIQELRQELTMHDALAGRHGVMYDEYTPEQQHEVSKMVKQYLEASPDQEDDVIKIESMRHAREIFKQFKLIVNNMESLVEQKLRKQFTLKSKLNADDSGFETKEMDREINANTTTVADGDYVGNIEDEGGYALGKAPAAARPVNLDTGSLSKSVMPGSPTGNLTPGSPGNKSTTGDDNEVSSPSVFDRQRLFEAFKSTPEAIILTEKLEKLQINTSKAKQRKRELRRKRRELSNSIKVVQAAYETRRKTAMTGEQKRGLEEEVLDEEEWKLLVDLKEQKNFFKSTTAELSEISTELDNSVRELDDTKDKLLETFEEWAVTPEAQRALGNAINNNRDRQLDYGDEDVLDDGEMFDKMEIERVLAEDPKSLAFVMAQKEQRKYTRAGKGGTGKKRRAKKGIR